MIDFRSSVICASILELLACNSVKFIIKIDKPKLENLGASICIHIQLLKREHILAHFTTTFYAIEILGWALKLLEVPLTMSMSFKVVTEIIKRVTSQSENNLKPIDFSVFFMFEINQAHIYVRHTNHFNNI